MSLKQFGLCSCLSSNDHFGAVAEFTELVSNDHGAGNSGMF